MKKSLVVVSFLLLIISSTYAQKQCPGQTVIGYGYDIFDEYANNKSVKEPLFRFENFSNRPMDDGSEYKIPDLYRLKFINEKDYKTTEGSSLRQYASHMANETGLEVDALVFSGSIEARFSKDKAEKSSNYFYTITDWSRIWKVSINPVKERNGLRQFLSDDAKKAIDTWDANELFELFGTHYVSSGYFGGAMEFNLSESFKSREEAMSIEVSVQAKYKAVSGSNDFHFDENKKSEEKSKNVKIYARGGDSQYANKSSAGDNSQYNLWVKSIPSKAVLIDFEPGSLVGIWTLAEGERKAELEAAFKLKLAQFPLPEGNNGSLMTKNYNFFIQPLSEENLIVDIKGYHTQAEGKGAKVSLHEKDNANSTVLQGADRFIKVIGHPSQFEYVYLQPQHSKNVFDIAGAAKTEVAPLQLWDKNNSDAQLFKMIEVSGKKDVYYIQNKGSGLYLTSNGKGAPITQEKKTRDKNQKWKFTFADPKTQMAPPQIEGRFAIRNVESGRYIDVPGGAPNQDTKEAKLQLWDMDQEPDRYFEIKAQNKEKTIFTIMPLHSNNVFDIKGGSKSSGAPLQLWNHTNSNAQLFRFEYGGEPLVYHIVNVNSNLLLEGDISNIRANGCKIRQAKLQQGKNNHQKWELLETGDFWHMPDPNQKFYIKHAYSSKYWDLGGTGDETNKNGKKFKLWSKDEGGDRKFKFKSANDHSWVIMEVQNGGRAVDVPNNSNKSNVQLQLWDKQGNDAQKFAIFPTSPTTFVLRTKHWKAISVTWEKSEYSKFAGFSMPLGGPKIEDKSYKRNGSKIIQKGLSYSEYQQWQLIYADGQKKGQVYKFFK